MGTGMRLIKNLLLLAIPLFLFSSTTILNKTPSKPTAVVELAGGNIIIPIQFGKNPSTGLWEPLRAILLSDSWRLLLVLKGGNGYV
jgi:hypothetical protein